MLTVKSERGLVVRQRVAMIYVGLSRVFSRPGIGFVRGLDRDKAHDALLV